MNNTIDISVIIPLYNKENYIKKTLQSIFVQKEMTYEIIIVNDGSTDQSYTIVKKLADNHSNIRLIDIKNGGVSNARNIGLKYAKGTWIQFLDADDILKPNYFEMISKELTDIDSDVDIIFTNFDMVDENNNVTKHIAIDSKGYKNQDQLIHSFMNHQYKNGYFGYISNKLIKRVLIEELGVKFPVHVKLAEDLAFYVQIYPFVNKVLFTEIDSFNYLQTENNYIFNENIDYRSQLWIQLMIKNWLINANQYEEYKEQIDTIISNYVYFTVFDANEKKMNLSSIVNEFYADQKICESIYLKNTSGLKKLVLTSVKKNHTLFMNIIFSARNMIRMIYRKVIKK